jgi:hypothetical protein
LRHCLLFSLLVSRFIILLLGTNYFFAATNDHPKTRIAPFYLTVSCGKATDFDRIAALRLFGWSSVSAKPTM